ncbi:hypothetical protein EVAR_100865_1 [Eumeta japonica]|uniref:Uncharacterized protein n=1 Tax=Eumeta variegata TaxID=151549 RepID=A0A4C1SDD1_EUMVA|nr:hypothetical protein EVAR_100865_1 [Eumeta japonica]
MYVLQYARGQHRFKNGACIHLEQKMEKDMLWLACRHHVMEIIWSDIDQADYKAVSSDASSLQTVENIAAYIISFAQDQLNRYQPRDDYKELLNLTIIYLGGIPGKRVSFRMPAGLHRARWMAKAILSQDLLFGHQFKLSKREETAIKEICVFTVSIYVKYWYQAPSCAAPRNDLQLLKDLVSFQNINKAMSQNAIHKILGHLWYLSEELSKEEIDSSTAGVRRASALQAQVVRDADEIILMCAVVRGRV